MKFYSPKFSLRKEFKFSVGQNGKISMFLQVLCEISNACEIFDLGILRMGVLR
jgi:hypothetical protein